MLKHTETMGQLIKGRGEVQNIKMRFFWVEILQTSNLFCFMIPWKDSTLHSCQPRKKEIHMCIPKCEYLLTNPVSPNTWNEVFSSACQIKKIKFKKKSPRETMFQNLNSYQEMKQLSCGIKIMMLWVKVLKHMAHRNSRLQKDLS